jgi:hypothetical protein
MEENKMNFKEAIEYMTKGGTVKHNDNVYFINEPSIMESNGEPNDQYELYENNCNIGWDNIDKLFHCEFEVVE